MVTGQQDDLNIQANNHLLEQMEEMRRLRLMVQKRAQRCDKHTSMVTADQKACIPTSKWSKDSSTWEDGISVWIHHTVTDVISTATNTEIV